MNDLKKYITKIKIVLWLLFSFSMLFFAVYNAIFILDLKKHHMNIEYLSYTILLFELSLAGLTAIKNNNHFPDRDIIRFFYTALMFYIVLKKDELELYKIIGLSIIFVILFFLNMIIKILHKKYKIDN